MTNVMHPHWTKNLRFHCQRNYWGWRFGIQIRSGEYPQIDLDLGARSYFILSYPDAGIEP